MYPNFASAFATAPELSQCAVSKDLPIAFATRLLCIAEILTTVWDLNHFDPYLTYNFPQKTPVVN